MNTTINFEDYGITVKNGFGFFWGGILSQWYKSTFIVDEKKFYNAEQFMMYQKAVIFNDMQIADKILKTKDPKKVKALGRAVKGFNKTIWDAFGPAVVLEGNLEKFLQNPELATILKATEGLELVEASPYDTIWGIGLHATDPRAIDKKLWKGQNLLGLVLGDVREALIAMDKEMQ